MNRLIGADHLADTSARLLLLRHLGRSLLRVAPVVENANLMYALQRARRCAPFLGLVLPIEIFHRVLLERNSGIAALLRAPVDQAVLTDVEVTRAARQRQL